jgi:predicted Zn-dependent protease
MAADSPAIRHGRTTRRRTLAAASLVLAACDSPTAFGERPAYDPTSITGGLVYRWPTGRTIAVYVDPTNAPSADSLRAAVVAGTRAWSDAIHFREFSWRFVTDPSDADVIVHVATAPRLVGNSECAYDTGGGGYTFFCPSEGLAVDSALTLPLLSGRPGRVKIDLRVDPGRVNGQAGLVSLVTHELGHVVGIGAHSNDVRDVMFGAPRVTVPSRFDAQTLRYVLHQPADIRL